MSFSIYTVRYNVVPFLHLLFNAWKKICDVRFDLLLPSILSVNCRCVMYVHYYVSHCENENFSIYISRDSQFGNAV